MLGSFLLLSLSIRGFLGCRVSQCVMLTGLQFVWCCCVVAWGFLFDSLFDF